MLSVKNAVNTDPKRPPRGALADTEVALRLKSTRLVARPVSGKSGEARSAFTILICRRS